MEQCARLQSPWWRSKACSCRVHGKISPSIAVAPKNLWLISPSTVVSSTNEFVTELTSTAAQRNNKLKMLKLTKIDPCTRHPPLQAQPPLLFPKLIRVCSDELAWEATSFEVQWEQNAGNRRPFESLSFLYLFSARDPPNTSSRGKRLVRGFPFMSSSLPSTSDFERSGSYQLWSSHSLCHGWTKG